MSEAIQRFEVYQEFKIKFEAKSRDEVCNELESVAGHKKWHRVIEEERRIENDSIHNSYEVIVFERAEYDQFPAIRVLLVPIKKGDTLDYQLGNVVPVKVGGLGLGINGYNYGLELFIHELVIPANERLSITYKLSARHQCLTDWTSEEAAKALHDFSAFANKATGTAHPADEKRFRTFVAIDHLANKHMEETDLRKWLIFVEAWPEEYANELTSKWKEGRDLLARYDQINFELMDFGS